MKEELQKALIELNTATKLKDELELEYELEKARMLFSAEVDSLKNQSQRDSQVTMLMHDNGWDRDIAIVRTRAKIAYYTWSTYKSLVDSA